MPERLQPALTFLAYLLLGLLAGAIGTIGHRSRFATSIGPIWAGLIAALLAVFLIGLGLRLYLGGRLPATGFAIGVALAIFLLSLSGAEHSVLIPVGHEGIGVGEIWTFGGSVTAFLPLIWPDLRGRARYAGRQSRKEPTP